ncbi:hypothetical protein TNCV_4361771 [Trichonephila clavipes]|nr:hypothetical protein TNCV_4361771 [Trichonephila clavipes]
MRKIGGVDLQHRHVASMSRMISSGKCAKALYMIEERDVRGHSMRQKPFHASAARVCSKARFQGWRPVRQDRLDAFPNRPTMSAHFTYTSLRLEGSLSNQLCGIRHVRLMRLQTR